MSTLSALNIGNLLFVLIITGFLSLVSCDVGDSCGSKLTGKCVLVTDCKPAEDALKKRKHHGLERCGFQGDLEIVCCNEHRDFAVRRPDTRKSVIACKDFEFVNAIPFIMGGNLTSPGEYPHMASLGYEDETKNEYNFECGGSLISDTFVLTAAHCLINRQPKIVRLGTVDILGKDPEIIPQDIPIKDVIIHDLYVWEKNINDIALLRLSKPIERTKFVNPICLYLNDEEPKDIIVCGFGKTSESMRNGSRYLLKASLVTVDISLCNITAQRRVGSKPVFDTQICATYEGDIPMDTCRGDSGGPMFVESKRVNGVNMPSSLVGVTSFGPLCGSKQPGIYTRVSKYIDWIESIVWP